MPRSLLEGIDTGETKPVKSSGGKKDSERIKLFVALGLFAAAAVAFAFTLGIIPNPFDDTAEPTPPPPEVIAETQQYQQEIQQEIDAGRVSPAGN